MKNLKNAFILVVKMVAILVILAITLYLSTAFGAIAIAWYLRYPGFEAWAMVVCCAILTYSVWHLFLIHGSRRVLASTVI